MSLFFRVFSSVLVLVGVVWWANGQIGPARAAEILTENFSNLDQFVLTKGVEIDQDDLVLSQSGGGSEDFPSFADGSIPTGWIQYSNDEVANWSIMSNTLRYFSNDYDFGRVFWQDTEIQNGEVAAQISLIGGEQIGGLVFRAQDENTYYVAEMSSLYNFIGLRKVVNGASSMVSSVVVDLDAATYYELKVVYVGSNFEFYLDNILVYSITDGSIAEAGMVGFYRQGTDMAVNSISATNTATVNGKVISQTFPQADNISSVSFSQLGENLSNQAFVLVSNDGANSWHQLASDQTLVFPKPGDQFAYQVQLRLNGLDLPRIDQLSFSLELGPVDTHSRVRHQNLNQIHYQNSGNSLLNESLNPNHLTLVDSITNAKPVQQMTIIKQADDIWLVYSDSDNNQAVAYNLTTQQQVWATPLNGYLESTPYIYDGVVYIGGYDHKMYALDLITGAINWTYEANNTMSGAPTYIRDGILYFADYGYGGVTTLYAININNQELVWSYSANFIGFLSFTLDEFDDLLYVTHQDYVVALRASDGEERWRNHVQVGYITKQPVIAGDRLVVGADRGLVVLDRFTGSTLLSNPDGFTQVEEGIGASPAVDGQLVYYPTKSSALLIARNLMTGELVWSTAIEDEVGTFASPALTDDGYIYVSYNSGMRAFDQTTGEQVWISQEPAWAENNPAIGYGYLAFTDPEGTGTIHAYQVSQESYQSATGISLARTDQEMTSITVDSQPSADFSCLADVLQIPESGLVTINYGPLPQGLTKPFAMIINPLAELSFRACHPAGEGIYFTYPLSVDYVSQVLKDGQALPGSQWSFATQLLTITDSFSAHTYTVDVTQPSPVPSPAPTTSSSSTTRSTTSSDNPICHQKLDQSADLFELRAKQDQVRLFLTPPNLEITQYLVEYGPVEAPNRHAAILAAPYANGVVELTIGSLQPLPGQFVFKVQAIQGCAHGSWSQELAIPVGLSSEAVSYWSQSAVGPKQQTRLLLPTVPRKPLASQAQAPAQQTLPSQEDSSEVVEQDRSVESKTTSQADVQNSCRLEWAFWKTLSCWLK